MPSKILPAMGRSNNINNVVPLFSTSTTKIILAQSSIGDCGEGVKEKIRERFGLEECVEEDNVNQEEEQHQEQLCTASTTSTTSTSPSNSNTQEKDKNKINIDANKIYSRGHKHVPISIVKSTLNKALKIAGMSAMSKEQVLTMYQLINLR
uniref:Wsv130 n=6 Tax=White spot syndrome virus TaxID=342409 RepID=A0A2U9GB52_WSSV|nr:wsv130 [Shrimp white spot syndrome virus]AWQ61579.1 wsv130 [Shrimp white spot syndrome virus]